MMSTVTQSTLAFVKHPPSVHSTWLQILRLEMERAMGLLGVGSIEQLKAEGLQLVKRRHVSPRDGLGARYSQSGII